MNVLARPSGVRLAALLTATLLLEGCVWLAPVLEGPATLAIREERGAEAAVSIGGSTVEASLERAGEQAARWRVDDLARDIPAGEYTLVVWTEHHSDDIGCTADPDAETGWRCERDSIVIARCRTEVTVLPGAQLAYRYTRDGDDQCELRPRLARRPS